MSKDQRLYLLDILERVSRIEQVAAEGESVFRSSFMHQDTIIRNFEVIGEIVKRLDPALTTQQPQVRWSGYAGFRDILIHRYDSVILDVVWESTQSELTELKTAVQNLIDILDKDKAE